jgi:protein-tyrosine-phosphatase
MAEAIALRDSADVIDASSAGLAPLGFVAEMTKATLTSNGYATDGLASKPILREVWDAADIVINMSGRPREHAFRNFAKVEDWEIEDPYGEDPEVYQRTFEEVRRHVAGLTAKLHRAARAPALNTESASNTTAGRGREE